nr:alcohol dehydrogenase catalytic domain-containing protein [uncultured Sphaerochaeta sp.]
MANKMTGTNIVIAGESSSSSQKVAIVECPRKIKLIDAEIPMPGPDEIRVRIKYVGICGSDLEVYRGHRQAEFISFPSGLGHEVAGVIDKVGTNVIGLAVGDRVTCRYVWGAYAEYIVCNPFNVKVVPSRLTMKQTSLLEVLPGIMHAAELANVTEKSSVLIMGQGVSGLLLTQVFSLFSPRHLVCTDLNDKNLQLARKYGATHTVKVPSKTTSTREALGSDFPEGFDIVVPALLEGDGLVDAIDIASFCGRIILYGCIGLCSKTVDLFKVHKKRLEIYSTEPRRDIDMRRLFNESLNLVLDGLVNTSEIVDLIMPLQKSSEAFEIRNNERNDIIHVLIDCNPEVDYDAE